MLSPAPSTDKCLSHQGMLKARICQLQTACRRHVGAYKHPTFQPSEGGLACRQHGERRGRGTLFYTHVYTFHTLIFSDRHANYPRASGSALLHEGCCESPRAAAGLEANGPGDIGDDGSPAGLGTCF